MTATETYPDDYAVSIHEAGHCVAAWTRGLPIKRVSVDPGPDHRGVLLLSRAWSELEASSLVTMHLCGAEAERHIIGRCIPGADVEDEKQALNFARWTRESDGRSGHPATMEALDRGRALAAALVACEAPRIRIIAERLRQARTLSGDAIARILAPPTPDQKTLTPITTAPRPEDVNLLDLFPKGKTTPITASILVSFTDAILSVAATQANLIDALQARISSIEMRPKGLEYKGTWAGGEVYERGDCVTRQGSLWVAKTDDCRSMPGADAGDGWQLAVKKGRDARDAA